MKLIKLFSSIIAVLLLATACTDDDALIFLVPEDSAGNTAVFTNTFLSEYLISNETASNIAERFVWDPVDFGVPSPVNYDLQGSMDENFGDFELITTTTATNAAVTVGELLDFANEMELQPDTPATVYFRVRSYLGSGQGDQESLSDAQSLTIRLIVAEDGSGIEIVSWGLVGAAFRGWDEGPQDITFYSTGSPDVFVTYATSYNGGEFKIRENGQWSSNLGPGGDGVTLEPNGGNFTIEPGDYKFTLDLNANTLTWEAFSWGVVGSAYNDWGGAGPDALMFYDYTTDSFKVGVKLLDGEFKFRPRNTWENDLGQNGDGVLAQPGNNIAATAGYYAVQMDPVGLTFSVAEAQLWGVVGSGYNDWGGAGPDFLFTEVNPGIWLAQGVTLVDGEIKFRPNDEWNGDLGRTGEGSNVLESPGNNIPVSAGLYDIVLDFSDPAAPTYALYPRS